MSVQQTQIDSNAVEAWYLRAEATLLTMRNSGPKIGFCTTIKLHWIGESNCFWYVRVNKAGREYRLVNASSVTNEFAFDHATSGRLISKVADKEIRG